MSRKDLTAVAEFCKLRQKAEAILRDSIAQAPCSPASVSAEDTLRALHELSVHQIELEMQNEELRLAMEEVELARFRYSDFYDLNPAGFCSLDDRGQVVEANLTLAGMLGVQREGLLGQPFVRYLLQADRNSHAARFQQLMETGGRFAERVSLAGKDGPPLQVHLAALALSPGDGAAVCRVVVCDLAESPLNAPST